MAKVKVTLTKSVIGKPKTQRETVIALGLRKMHQTVEHEDNPQFRGQVAKVGHLVTVQEI